MTIFRVFTCCCVESWLLKQNAALIHLHHAKSFEQLARFQTAKNGIATTIYKTNRGFEFLWIFSFNRADKAFQFFLNGDLGSSQVPTWLSATPNRDRTIQATRWLSMALVLPALTDCRWSFESLQGRPPLRLQNSYQFKVQKTNPKTSLLDLLVLIMTTCPFLLC